MEREYSRIIHLTLIASVRASSAREADRLINEAALGKLSDDVLDESGTLVEGLMGGALAEHIERRGVQFSYAASLQEPLTACSNEDMGKWLAWCSDGHIGLKRFNRKDLAAAKLKYEPDATATETRQIERNESRTDGIEP